MKRDDVINAVKDLAKATNSEIGLSDWYVFGSAIKDFGFVTDIDILAVCDSDDEADKIRGHVDLDAYARTIHLSIFTRSEEAEIKFVERQGCVRVL